MTIRAYMPPFDDVDDGPFEVQEAPCVDKRITCIIDHYGVKNQLRKAQEELVELISEVSSACKGRANVDAITDEIADVTIMLEQLKVIFGIMDAVAHRVEFKLDRRMERIRKGE